MLVMAIEGIRQLAPADRLITGYTIKDATFTKSIPISANPDESTETQLFIQSSNDAKEKGGKSWSKFRICIWENNRWVETCAGTIRAEYEEIQNEVSTNKDTVITGRPNYTMQKIKDDIVTCTKTLDVDKAYKHFASSGIEYGSTFQRLRDIHYNDKRQVAGTIDLFQWLPVENTNHSQPHVVHPASFDALAQLLYLAISNGAENPTPTAVPTRVEKIWISGTGLSYPDSSSIDAAGATIDRGFRQIVGSAFASDIDTGNVLASIENLEYTTVVAQNSLSTTSKDEKNLFFSPKWLPSMFQPIETKIWDFCAEAEPPKPERVAFNESLFAMIHGFIHRALKVIDPSSIEAKPSHIQKYYAWMKHAMDEGALEHPDKTRAEWESLLEDEEHHKMLCETHKYAGEGKFHNIIGENLVQIIAGEVDPLAIFFKDNLVGEYYEHINKVVISYEPVGRYLEVLSHGNPHIKVLEIGAGTGGSTRKVLGSLKKGSQLGYSKYTFTDISPFFFEGAKKQFPEHLSRMEFRTLDIESDPVEQGFELGTYDVIVAAAVS
jgi:acyl transferase domain-containing protein